MADLGTGTSFGKDLIHRWLLPSPFGQGYFHHLVPGPTPKPSYVARPSVRSNDIGPYERRRDNIPAPADRWR